MDACVHVYNSKSISTKRIVTEIIVYCDSRYATCRCVWDTGAPRTNITTRLIDFLGATPIGRTTLSSIHGENVEHELYKIDIELCPGFRTGTLTAVGIDSVSKAFDVIIGMDVIGEGDFAISNFNGEQYMAFRSPSQQIINFTK